MRLNGKNNEQEPGSPEAVPSTAHLAPLKRSPSLNDEDIFGKMADYIEEIFWMLDAETYEVIYVSPAFERICGVPRETLYKAPTSYRDLIHEQDRQHVLSQLSLLPATGRFDEEFRIVRPDGTERWVAAHGFLVPDSSGVVKHLVGTAIDKTDKRALEEELRRSQKLDGMALLAGGISHDFNTMLTVILGEGELLLMNHRLPDRERRRLEAILHAAIHGRFVTRQLLAFGRQHPSKPAVIDPNKCIQDLGPHLMQMIPSHVTTLIDLEVSGCRVKIDPAHWTQSVMNVVLNARDAMPQGGGRLTIRSFKQTIGARESERPSVKSGDYFGVSISDTGAGIHPKVLPHIFEPFFSTKPEEKGSGLGLSVVHGMIDQGGGHILVSSQLGEGTTFTILLPLTEEPLTASDDERFQQKGLAGSETILVVDDDDVARRITAEFLSSHGYEILTANSGRQGIEVGRKHPKPIHLLVTDILLGQMSGPRLAEQLLRAHPKMKVLYMTAYADMMDFDELSVGEECDILRKPFRHLELMGKVRAALSTHAAP